MSDGKGRFVVNPAPGTLGTVSAAQFFDYDNDGLLDLVLFQNDNAMVMRNLGNKWEDVLRAAVARDLMNKPGGDGAAPASLPPLRFASGDVDCDGDTDIVVRLPMTGVMVARNDGGDKNHYLRVRLDGKNSNRNGIGSKLEMRSGSLQPKLE